MSTRRIKDGKVDGEKVYFKGHAKATFMSDGRTVEEAFLNKQDKLVSGTNLKTINGQSLLGEGNIPIEGGGSEVPIVDHGTGDTTFVLTPNTLHVWGEVASLSIDFGESVDGSLSEYMFRFSSGATPTTLTLPDSVSWANGMEVSIQSGKTYEVAIIDGYGCILEFDTISDILTFTLRNKEYQFDKGMTWGEWVDSEYNVDGFVIQYDEASSQYEVVCIETVDSGWSGTHYLIADPDKSAPTHVLKTEIVQSKEYTEFEDNYGVGGGGGGA